MTSFFARHIADFRRFSEQWRIARNRARTERFLSRLPDHLRKDIGWPDSYDGHFVRTIERQPEPEGPLAGFVPLEFSLSQWR